MRCSETPRISTSVKRALSPYNQALKHRLEDASWVCCSHYGLRLIVVRTATLLMRRLLWSGPGASACRARASCGRSHVHRAWSRSCGELRSKGWQQTTRHALIGAIRARDEVARREAGRRGRALDGRRDAPGLWSLLMMIGTSSNECRNRRNRESVNLP